MDICIVGGGLCGLTAALSLSDVASIDLVEKQPYLGGCLASYFINKYSIERFYHHCFWGDQRLIHLIKKLGLADELEWLKGTTGYYVDGTVYPLNTPLEILKFPHLSMSDKFRLTLLTLEAKYRDIGSLDAITAREYVIEHFGQTLYNSFFEPLLKSKFGESRGSVSAAWLMSRIAIRSNRGLSGERLGYIRGGFQLLIDRVASLAEQKGCKILMQTSVDSLMRKSDKWLLNGKLYDTVLFTIPPFAVTKITGIQLPPVPYQGAACLTLGIDSDIANGIYWLNMKDPAPYGAIISHTNFQPIERYGETIVYLASYFTGSIQDHLEQQMLTDFCKRFGVKQPEIHWQRMAIEPSAGPVYLAGFKALIPNYEQNGIYIAGMFSPPNYPERSMEGSIRTAGEVSDAIKKRFGYE